MSYVVRSYAAEPDGIRRFEPETFVRASDAQRRAEHLSRIVDAAIIETVATTVISEHVGRCRVYVGGKLAGTWDSADPSSLIR